MLEYSQCSLKDEGIIVAKAARIIRHFYFLKMIYLMEIFHYENKSSVESFLHLLSPIINGDTGSENLSGQAKRVAVNLAQLTRSNSAKYKRRSVEHLGSSLSNEPLLSVKIRLLIHFKTRKNVS